MYYTNIKHYTTITDPEKDEDSSKALLVIALLAVLVCMILITA